MGLGLGGCLVGLIESFEQVGVEGVNDFGVVLEVLGLGESIVDHDSKPFLLAVLLYSHVVWLHVGVQTVVLARVNQVGRLDQELDEALVVESVLLEVEVGKQIGVLVGFGVDALADEGEELAVGLDGLERSKVLDGGIVLLDVHVL